MQNRGESLRWGPRLMRAAAVTFVLASCEQGSDDPGPASVSPDVTAAIVTEDVAGRSDEYAFTYGMGLQLGCSSWELLRDNPDPDVQRAFEEAYDRSPADAREGFEAGLRRGYEEQARPDSDVC